MKYRPRRYLTDVAVSVVNDAEKSRARIHDISPHGARLSGAFTGKIGDGIVIEHLGARHAATLCWHREAEFGVVFKLPLSASSLSPMRPSGRFANNTQRHVRTSVNPF